jgi:catechol 2,3-dioxygenase-like lactoylglutathione lyase family enzyme
VDFGGVFGVKLPVSDLARSRHWYEQVFGFTVALEFPDHEGVVRGVAGSLPGLGDTRISLRENRPVAAALAGYDILHLSVASRDELEDWAAKLDRLTVEHSPIRDATSHWLMSVVEPDRLEVRLHSRESHSLDDAVPRPDRGRRVDEPPSTHETGPRSHPLEGHRSR